MIDDYRKDEQPIWDDKMNWLEQAEKLPITPAQYGLLVQKGLKESLLVYMTKAEAYRRIKRIIAQETTLRDKGNVEKQDIEDDGPF